MNRLNKKKKKKSNISAEKLVITLLFCDLLDLIILICSKIFISRFLLVSIKVILSKRWPSRWALENYAPRQLSMEWQENFAHLGNSRNHEVSTIFLALCRNLKKNSLKNFFITAYSKKALTFHFLLVILAFTVNSESFNFLTI